LGLFLAGIEEMSESSSTGNSSATDITKAMGQEMDMMSNGAANSWKMTSKISGR